MSPIFVRPVREQLEHDRLIRFLQGRYSKKFETTANVGEERTNPLKLGQHTYFPDLILMDGRKLGGVVEVESAESVNNLEALAQWVPFSKARVPFHLYVPMSVYDVARRLCDANDVKVAEIWTYRGTNDGFDLVRGFHEPASSPASAAKKSAKAKKPAPKKSAKAKKPGKR